MTIPVSGPLDLSTLRTEVGAVGAFDLNNAVARRLAGAAASGVFDLNTTRGGMLVGAGTAVNLFTLAGSPSTPGSYRAVVDSGTTVGSTSPSTAALSFGNFPAGSTVSLDIYGTVQGAGGAAGTGGAGGAGGSGVSAVTSTSFTKNVTLKSGGTLYGGGGGGGKGGAGGAGGAGGQGVVTSGGSTETLSYVRGFNDASFNDATGLYTFRWNGVTVGTAAGTSLSPGDGYTYSAGTFMEATTDGGSDPGGGGE